MIGQRDPVVGVGVKLTRALAFSLVTRLQYALGLAQHTGCEVALRVFRNISLVCVHHWQ